MVVVFASWGTSDVPCHTKYYIDKLAEHADEVHVCTNEDRPVDVSWFKERGYHLHMFPNKSRDFEKHYHWMMQQGREWVTKQDSVVLANDCLICYGPLDRFFEWAATRPEDLLGLNSSAFPIEHLQGYLLVMRQPMLGKVWDHFEATGVVAPLDEVKRYELKLGECASSMMPMFPQRNRRGWDELFWTPFEHGVPLVKHCCIMPRKVFILQRWQKLILRHGHIDAKGWAHLPLMPDPSYTPRQNHEPTVDHLSRELR